MNENDFDSEEIPQFFDTIDPSKTTLEDMDRLTNILVSLKNQIKEHENAIDSLKQELEPVEARLLQYLTQSGHDRYHSGAGLVHVVRQRFYAHPKGEDFERFKNYLPSVGIDPADILTINSQRLNAIVKEQIEQAESSGNPGFLPPGIKEATVKESIRIRKS